LYPDAVRMVNCATVVQHCITLKEVGIGVRPRICSEHSHYILPSCSVFYEYFAEVNIKS